MNTKALKCKMIEKGLNNVELAKRIGVTPQHFSTILNGKCQLTLKNANAIQKELEIQDHDFAYYFLEDGRDD